MKQQHIIFRIILAVGLLAMVGLTACEPSVVEKSELGPTPTPSFEIVTGSTPNEFILKNTTEGAFLTQWDLGDQGKYEGQEATVAIPFKGDYEVNMTTFSRGGSASASKTITVTQDDPNACSGFFAMLTDCNEKTWKLATEPGAMHIGPNLNDTWWGNSESDVSERVCHFNDEYIFRANGEFEYKSQGDFWADTDGNGNVTPSDLGVSPGCHSTSVWPTQYAAWGDGVHAFNVTPTTLSLNGDGAWMGLYKVGTSDEVTSPQSSVTYSILELTDTRMVLYADYGWGVWRLTFTSN